MQIDWYDFWHTSPTLLSTSVTNLHYYDVTQAKLAKNLQKITKEENFYSF